tara:strand:+ start:424 stop:756 length:333 start_codon:yes stop_codon:yes gene_type:complete
MISLLLSGCLAMANTSGRTIIQSQAKFADSTYQYTCVEEPSVGWSFLSLEADGCILRGSSVTIISKTGDVKNLHLHEVETCRFVTKGFLGHVKCTDIHEISLSQISMENK